MNDWNINPTVEDGKLIGGVDPKTSVKVMSLRLTQLATLYNSNISRIKKAFIRNSKMVKVKKQVKVEEPIKGKK